MAQQVDDLSQPVQTADGVVPKHSFNWTRLIITIVLVVLTAGALGGGVWYYMNQQSLKAEDAKNKEVEQLQKQIDELKKPAATSTSTTTATTATAASDWHVYRNSQYGFQLTFPEDWKGYTAATEANYQGASAAIGFKLPQQTSEGSLFVVYVFTKDAWTGVPTVGPRPIKFGETTSYVMASMRANGIMLPAGSTQTDKIDTILTSFKAL